MIFSEYDFSIDGVGDVSTKFKHLKQYTHGALGGTLEGTWCHLSVILGKIQTPIGRTGLKPQFSRSFHLL